MKYLLLTFCLIVCVNVYAQPQPCGTNPAMTSFCSLACVICDIDGYTGTNDLTAQGQGFPEFCTTQYNNMQYIAFIAGTEDLSVEVDVKNCTTGWGVEIGFFESFDCQTFTPITFCNTDIISNTSFVFNNEVPLVVGQHYYLVMDGSGGTNCDWTFSVIEGSTAVNPLTTSGDIEHPEEICPGIPATFFTSGDVGAAIFYWSVNGTLTNTNTQEVDLTFPVDGVYDICVTAANVCDQALPSCTTIKVRTIENLDVKEVICEGECVVYNGKDFCVSGLYQETITLSNNCDSIITLDLEVLPQSSVMADVWICNDQNYFIGSNAYNLTGSYTDTILTSQACDSIVFLELLSIECEIIGNTNQIPVLCKGTATGTLIFSIDQGTPPLNYVYTNIFDPSITGMGTSDLLINNEISNIPAGSYQIYITDNFGNDVVVSQVVTEPNYLEVDLIPADFGGYNVSCYTDLGVLDSNGSIEAIASGGVAPYDYAWSDGQGLAMAVNLSNEEYFLTLTDANDCSIVSSIILVSPPEINTQVYFENPNCEGFESGEILIENTSGGVSPYMYALNQSQTFSSDSVFLNLEEGQYAVFLRDANGCVIQVDSNLVAPDIPVVDLDEDLSIELGDSIQLFPFLNDTELINIAWSNGSALSCEDCLEPYARPFDDAQFIIEVTSKDDCKASASLNVRVEKIRKVYTPNVFSPNGDFTNEVFTVFGNKAVEEIQKLQVFDGWGNMVYNQANFKSGDEVNGWDGNYGKEILNPGIYVWSAEVLYLDKEVIRYHGEITLLR